MSIPSITTWARLPAFAKELGLNLTQEELNGQVGTSHQFFLHMLVDWFERAGKGHFTGEEALAVGTSGRMSVRATIRL